MINNFKIKYDKNNYIELIENNLYITYNNNKSQMSYNLFYIFNEEYSEKLQKRLGKNCYNKIINKLIYEQSKAINKLRKTADTKKYNNLVKLNKNDIFYSWLYNEDKSLLKDNIKELYQSYSLKSAYEYTKCYYSELLTLQKY